MKTSSSQCWSGVPVVKGVYIVAKDRGNALPCDDHSVLEVSCCCCPDYSASCTNARLCLAAFQRVFRSEERPDSLGRKVQALSADSGVDPPIIQTSGLHLSQVAHGYFKRCVVSLFIPRLPARKRTVEARPVGKMCLGLMFNGLLQEDCLP